MTIDQLDALLEAPVLITILVGAADGELDREERTWSDRLMQSRTYNKPHHLNEYYSVVANGFLSKIDDMLAALPQEIDPRNQWISNKLAGLNVILATIEEPLGSDLYKSYIALARETAKASGGFLRIGAISAAEAPWVNLPMLTQILPTDNKKENPYAEEDDEEERRFWQS